MVRSIFSLLVSGFMREPHQIDNGVLATIHDAKLLKSDSATICNKLKTTPPPPPKKGSYGIKGGGGCMPYLWVRDFYAILTPHCMAYFLGAYFLHFGVGVVRIIFKFATPTPVAPNF